MIELSVLSFDDAKTFKSKARGRSETLKRGEIICVIFRPYMEFRVPSLVICDAVELMLAQE